MFIICSFTIFDDELNLKEHMVKIWTAKKIGKNSAIPPHCMASNQYLSNTRDTRGKIYTGLAYTLREECYILAFVCTEKKWESYDNINGIITYVSNDSLKKDQMVLLKSHDSPFSFSVCLPGFVSLAVVRGQVTQAGYS